MSKLPGLIDHRYTDHPVCPYCGYVHKDSWEWSSDEDGEHDCDSCSRKFTWTSIVTRTWSTRRLPPVRK